MNLKTTLTILAGFVCAVMTTSAYCAVTLGENVAADEQNVVVENDAKGGYYAVSIGQGATTEKANFGVAIGTESIALYAGPQGQGSVAVGTRATAEHGGLPQINKFSQLNMRIERAEKRLHAGIAGIAAIASISYVASNRFSYGVAVGNYQNANALAGGIQYKTSPNTTIRLNVSLDSSHNAALAVGVGGGW
ncbi:YadA-like C-terminal region family protein [Serratia symbiotica SCt-VLC]|uniref:YadA-like C-terminal region family protein n=1 Tax=Serratia symbiotica SCt-VLC TaxID=1347341 RepID=A0A068RD09_9GAMM|nr:YadA-like C-terminal region family protein [Serratia symbiotica SCt-VLC]